MPLVGLTFGLLGWYPRSEAVGFPSIFHSLSDMTPPYVQPMLRDNALAGKTIIVTGGGTGLGRAMTTYFLQLGANVTITSRKLDVLEATAAELRQQTGGRVLAVACDVRKYDEIEKMLAQTLAEFGGVDVLLNNAAGNFISPTERLSHKAFDVIVDIVLRGSYNCTLALGKHWIAEKKPGTILNIITTYASVGSAYVVPSAAAKAGVLAITRSLAVEWAKYGIRSNAIAPGPFPTEGAWSRLCSPNRLASKLDPAASVPLKRVGQYQELANLAAYLVSDFSAYVNGEVVTIDGGEWLNGAGEFNKLELLTPGNVGYESRKPCAARPRIRADFSDCTDFGDDYRCCQSSPKSVQSEKSVVIVCSLCIPFVNSSNGIGWLGTTLLNSNFSYIPRSSFNLHYSGQICFGVHAQHHAAAVGVGYLQNFAFG